MTAGAEKSLDPGAVRHAAVALLARRDFASGELCTKLKDAGYDATLVQATVAELVAGRIVNDARYAENFVAYYAERGQGPVRIRARLRTLALPADLIDAALAIGPDWKARAREVRIRRFGLTAPQSLTEKSRQARFLQYRGFSSDHIRGAIGPDFDSNE